MSRLPSAAGRCNTNVRACSPSGLASFKPSPAQAVVFKRDAGQIRSTIVVADIVSNSSLESVNDMTDCASVPCKVAHVVAAGFLLFSSASPAWALPEPLLQKPVWGLVADAATSVLPDAVAPPTAAPAPVPLAVPAPPLLSPPISVEPAVVVTSNPTTLNMLPQNSSIPPELTVTDYWNYIIKNRPVAWKFISKAIQSNNWEGLQDLLLVPPFTDLQQACYYVPPALLQADEYNSAIDTRKAYKDFVDHVNDFYRVAARAENGATDAAQVQQAFFLMSASVDSFIQAIPKKYLVVIAPQQ